MSDNFRTTAVLKKKTSICLIYVSLLYLRWKKLRDFSTNMEIPLFTT